MQDITGTNTFTTPLKALTDGDISNGPNQATVMQGYANRTTYLNTNKVDKLTGTNKLEFASRSLTRSFFPGAGDTLDLTQWTPLAWLQIDASGADCKTILKIPIGATLTNVRYWLKGASAYGSGAIPFTTTAQAHVHWRPDPTVSWTSTGSVLDTSADLTEFKTMHYIDVPMSLVVTNSQLIYAGFQAELGTGFVAGSQFHQVDATFTTAAYDDGAA